MDWIKTQSFIVLSFLFPKTFQKWEEISLCLNSDHSFIIFFKAVNVNMLTDAII